ELIYSLSDPFLWVHVLKFLRACHNGLLYLRRHPFHVGVRASKGFPDYSIDQFQRQHILAGQFQQLRGLLFEVPTAPQDRRTIFGRDDGIPGVLQHEDPVADRDTQRTTRSSFTYYDANHRYPQAHHLLEVMGNGFTLSSLFGFQPGKGSRRIDEGYNRLVEFFRDPHQPKRLPVPFGIGHPKVSELSLLGISPLLLADQHVRLALDRTESPYHRFVVSYRAISMHLDKIVCDLVYIIQRVGAVRMPGKLDPLPAGEVLESFLFELPDLLFKRFYGILDISIAVLCDLLHVLQLPF